MDVKRVAHGRSSGGFFGHPYQKLAVVVAREMIYAREAAAHAQVQVKELPAILTIEDAMAANSFMMPAKGINRGDAAAAIAAAPRSPMPRWYRPPAWRRTR